MTEVISCSVKGHIDHIDAGCVRGWAFDPAEPDNLVDFYLVLDGNAVARGIAGEFREDLAQAGLGNGYCSFSVCLNLPLTAISGKKLSLVDARGSVLSELDITSDVQSLKFYLNGVDSTQMKFLCESSSSLATQVTLFCDDELIATKEVELASGDNILIIPLPPQLSRPKEGVFKLGVKGIPCFVWAEYVHLLPLVADRNLIPDATEQSLIEKNRRDLLTTCIHAGEPKEAVQAAESYAVLQGELAERVTLPLVACPQVSLVLPLNIDAADVRKMAASLQLSSPLADYELIWVTSSKESVNVDNLVIVKIPEQLTCVEVIYLVLQRLKGLYVIFCPSCIEFTPASYQGLITPLNENLIGFVTNKLVNDSGVLLDSGSEINSEFLHLSVMNGVAEHAKWSYDHGVDCALLSPCAYRASDLLKMGIPLNCSSSEEAFFYWQTTLRSQNRVGLSLGDSFCYATNPLDGDLAKPYSELNETLLEGAKQALSEFSPVSIKTGRPLLGTVLMLDAQTPSPDKDAGSYAALQEIRLIQSLGYKVIFVAMEFQHAGKYTRRLQKEGVEVCYAPFYSSVGDAIGQKLSELSAIYITRYNVAAHFLDFLKSVAPELPVFFNNADLHFLREIRSALSVSKDESSQQLALETAVKTREAELDVINKADVVLSYNDAEHAVITSHLLKQSNIFKCPWVLESKPEPASFDSREGIAFLGGYKHLPNVEAVDYFTTQVMPLLTKSAPEIKLYLYGSSMPESFADYPCPQLEPVGYVESLDEVYQKHKVFIAPLQSGAGIKGKVLESVAYGLPAVLSPVAAESTGLSHNMSALIAESPEQWVEYIKTLYYDQALWKRLSDNERILAREQYSFGHARNKMKKAFAHVKLESH